MSRNIKPQWVGIKEFFYLVGGAALCYGIWQIHPPAAWIAGGSLVFITSALISILG